MERIKVFELNQYVMEILGIHSHRLDEPSNEFYSSIMPYYFVCFDVVFLTISSAVFAVQNIDKLTLALQNVSLVVGGIQSAGMYISIGINMLKVKALHLKLQEVVNKGELFTFFVH